MGCCVSSGEERTDREPLAETRPRYSWEKKERPDRSQLIISGQVGVVVCRLPGQLSGRQFHIQDCRQCEIFVLDTTSSLTIHGCTDCTLVLGPCGGSVFVRQCEGCTVVVACQQFRARDCRKCTVYLHCKSQPVIESSHRLRFSCFQAYYDKLRGSYILTVTLSLSINTTQEVNLFTHSMQSATVKNYIG
ncbi:Protein XRP2 [Geodia barretti]|uniref:Protein XRP2 n=2 Tax=Geodia barretti TaxID=519541 RepID=A0AA35XJP1_GEOBA|nr:Protein XRP2 [Geodia barretti]